MLIVPVTEPGDLSTEVTCLKQSPRSVAELEEK